VTGPTPSCQHCPCPFWWLARNHRRERKCLRVMHSQQLLPFPNQILPSPEDEGFRTAGDVDSAVSSWEDGCLVLQREWPLPACSDLKLVLFHGGGDGSVLHYVLKTRHTFSHLKAPGSTL
jgi:hypothetical protein